MSSTATKVAAALLAGATLIGTIESASAERNRYSHQRTGVRYYGHHRGYGNAVGLGVAGAALGIIGAATAGAVANSYNGYPAYGYGPEYGYGAPYGYDYHPGYGYYGPY